MNKFSIILFWKCLSQHILKVSIQYWATSEFRKSLCEALMLDAG